jgi:hypothetical protein
MDMDERDMDESSRENVGRHNGRMRDGGII